MADHLYHRACGRTRKENQIDTHLLVNDDYGAHEGQIEEKAGYGAGQQVAHR